MKIRTRVVLGTVVPLLLVMIVGGVVLLLAVERDARASHRAGIQAGTAADAADIAVDMTRVGEVADGLAHLLRSIDELPDEPDLYRLAEDLALGTELAASVGVAFEAGVGGLTAPHVVRSTSGVVRIDLATAYDYSSDRRGETWFREPLAAGQPSWTPAYAEPALGAGRILTRTAPFTTRAGQRGVATASVRVDDLQRAVESLVTAGRSWVLLGRDGGVVSADGEDTLASAAVRDAAAPIVRMLRSSEGAGLGDMEGLDLFWHQVEGMRLILVVAVADRTLLGSVLAERLGLAGVIALAALVVAATGYVISGWITRPIERLTDLAGDLAAGDLDRRASAEIGSGGEIGQLALALDEMSVRLRQRIDELLTGEQRRFGQLMESTPDAVLILDHDGTVVDANHNAERLTGFAEERLRGRPATLVLDHDRASLVGDEDREDIGALRQAVVTTRTGDEVPVEATVSPIGSGDDRQLVVNLRDVTERLEAQSRLQQTAEYHRTVFEVADVGIMETDLQDSARILRANDAMGRMLGYAPDELVGRLPEEITHPDDLDSTDRVVDRVASGEAERVSVDKRYLHRDGHVVWVRLNAAVLPGSDGRPRRGIVAVTDVSARRRSEALIRGVFDNSPDGYLLIVDGVIVDVNSAACALLRRSRGDLVATSPERTFAEAAGSPAVGEAEDAFLQHWRAAIETDEPVAFDWTFERAEGPVQAGVIAAPIATDDERDVVLVLTRDMTEARRYQEQLVTARDAARAADRAKSEFLATMSHEIRTPMNGVVGMLELLATSPLEPEQQQMTATSLRSAKNLLAILNDILDFSKIEAGQLDLEAVATSVTDVIDDMGQVFGIKARENGNLIVLTADHAVPRWVEADPVRLRQILYNLVGNAVKFTSNGRVRVHASVGEHGSGLRLTVTDDGIGMTADQIETLFTPFRQAEQSTARRFGGTGLGLAIVGRLVEIMGGRIDVTSTPDVGSRFDVHLPLAPCPAPPDAPPPIDLAGVRVVAMTGDPDTDGVVENHLGAVGAEVVAESTVTALLARCRSDRVDVVVLGRGVSEDDRHRVAEELQSEAATRATQVVVTRPEGLDSVPPPGAHVVDSSPLRRRHLQLAVAVVVDRASPEPVNPLRHRADNPSSVNPSSVPVPSNEDAEAGGSLVLIVDDHPVNRDVLTRQVRLLGYASQVAVDGEQALEMLAKRSYGLVLSDVHMPRMDGYEFCRRVRQQETDGERLPIVAVTANAMRGEDDRAFAAGMDGYLTKPTDLRSLRTALERWLGPSQHRDAVARTEGTDDDGTDDGVPARAAGAEPDKPVLDPDVLADLFPDDEAAVGELLRDYAGRLAGSRDAFFGAVEGEDDDELMAQAHRLASSAAMIGAVDLAHAARHVEALARDGDGTGARTAAPAVEAAIGRLEVALEERVAEIRDAEAVTPEDQP